MNTPAKYPIIAEEREGGFFRWLEYLLPRSILGIILMTALFYISASFYHHTLFPGGKLPVFFLAFISALAGVSLGFALWNAACKAMFRLSYNKAESAVKFDDYQKALKHFRAAFRRLNDAYYSASERQTETLLLLDKAAKFFSSAGLNDSEALALFHRYFHTFPDDNNFAQLIVPLVINSHSISQQDIELLETMRRLIPENDKLKDFITKQYLLYQIFSVESQEVLLDNIRRDSEWKYRALKFLLPKMLEADRRDPRALEVYLHAYEAGIENKLLNQVTGEIAEKVRFDSYPSELALKIAGKFKSLPDSEIERITAIIRDKRIDEVPVAGRLVKERELATEQEDTSIRESAVKPKLNLQPIGSLFFKLLYPLRLVFNLITVILSSLYSLIVKQRRRLKWVLIIGFAAAVVFGFVRIFPTMFSSRQEQMTVISEKPLTLQVAAFKERERAVVYVRQLKSNGISAYISADSGKSVWYQVRTGHFDYRPEAAIAADSLLKAKKINAYFVANFTSGEYDKNSE